MGFSRNHFPEIQRSNLYFSKKQTNFGIRGTYTRGCHQELKKDKAYAVTPPPPPRL
jgi:hypothetical protein